MGQVLHGSAKTTHTIRAAIQRSQASIKALSARYDLNPKTVAKWKKRDHVEGAPMGPKHVRSTVLSAEEEATPRLRRRFVSLAKNPSIALSHEEEVGVK